MSSPTVSDARSLLDPDAILLDPDFDEATTEIIPFSGIDQTIDDEATMLRDLGYSDNTIGHARRFALRQLGLI